MTKCFVRKCMVVAKDALYRVQWTRVGRFYGGPGARVDVIVDGTWLMMAKLCKPEPPSICQILTLGFNSSYGYYDLCVVFVCRNKPVRLNEA